MAIRFPTTGDYFEAAAAASINDLTTGTALVAFYPTSLAAMMNFFAKGVGNFVFRFSSGTSGTIDFSIARATTSLQCVPIGPVVTVNAWNYVAVVWNTAGVAGDQIAYIGGPTTPLAAASSYTSQQAGTGAVTSNAANNLRMGVSSAGSQAFSSGQIDMTQLYNRVLTLGEIQDIFRRPRALSGCVGWWKYGYHNGAAGPVPDLSGNGNNATKTGTPTLQDNAPFGALRRAAPITSMANYVAPAAGVSVTKRSARRRRAVAALAAMGWMR